MYELDNRRILLVDDLPQIHEDFRKILTESHAEADIEADEAILFGAAKSTRQVTQGFQMDSAFQGQEALQKLKEALAKDLPYALAFIDMRMPPGWDGVETVE